MPQKETGCHDSKEEEGNHHPRVPAGKVMFLHQERKVERHNQYDISGKPIEKHQLQQMTDMNTILTGDSGNSRFYR